MHCWPAGASGGQSKPCIGNSTKASKTVCYAIHIFVCPTITKLLFPFHFCQWTHSTQALKEFMEQMFYTSHFDVYEKATSASGLGCPKTADLCPIM